MNKCRGFEGSPPRLLDSEEHIFRLTYNTEDDCETDISMELIVAEIVMFHIYEQKWENIKAKSSLLVLQRILKESLLERRRQR